MTRAIRGALLFSVTLAATALPAAAARTATCFAGTPASFSVGRAEVSNRKTVDIPDGAGLPGGYIALDATLTTGRDVFYVHQPAHWLQHHVGGKRPDVVN